ncbi:MAG: hypothetical protein AB4041_12980 [Microcystaceae cyanobacterium]
MTFPSCSLWMFVARTDVSFMMHTIPHLVKMSNFPFEEKVLTIDTAPLSGEKTMRPYIGTMEQLRKNCQKLLDDGVVDRVIDIEYNPRYQNRIYEKHFNARMHPTHNYKGYPIYGSILKIEECKSDYILHFDSDMMLYQVPNYSWVKEGIQTMEQYEELMAVRPLSGPPYGEGKLLQDVNYDKGEGDYYRFKFFGSRAYLINRKRFDKLVPFPIIWRPYRKKVMEKLPNNLQTFLNYFTRKGKLQSWEVMVSAKLEQTQYYRGTLSNPQAWTLHPTSRSPEFFAALPKIIKRIEAGDYPEKQAGYYDLNLELWL